MEIIAVVWLLCAVACAMHAGSKNRSRGGWAIAGFFFGLFALLVVAVLPPLAATAAPAPAAPPAPPAGPLVKTALGAVAVIVALYFVL